MSKGEQHEESTLKVYESVVGLNIAILASLQQHGSVYIRAKTHVGLMYNYLSCSRNSDTTATLTVNGNVLQEPLVNVFFALFDAELYMLSIR